MKKLFYVLLMFTLLAVNSCVTISEEERKAMLEKEHLRKEQEKQEVSMLLKDIEDILSGLKWDEKIYEPIEITIGPVGSSRPRWIMTVYNSPDYVGSFFLGEKNKKFFVKVSKLTTTDGVPIEPSSGLSLPYPGQYLVGLGGEDIEIIDGKFFGAIRRSVEKRQNILIWTSFQKRHDTREGGNYKFFRIKRILQPK
ncbi:MAG: hypothetical protein QMD44_11840 [Thermodesulfovibrionales bacterium]|nr:hypothetical protein [Thermodesulfovibrionales bacterium]